MLKICFEPHTWSNLLAAVSDGHRKVWTLARWLETVGLHSQCLVDTNSCDLANGSADKLWWGLQKCFSVHAGNINPNSIRLKKFVVKLTDCNSPHGSSECSASACLPQTLEASGKQHTLRWGCWEPAASVREANTQKPILLIPHTWKCTRYVKEV